MTREEKGKIIDELSQKFASFPNFYITDASGLTVEEVNSFRKLCYKYGIEYKVVKNSLIKKALATLKNDYSPLKDKAVLKGFSGILFAKADGANLPAKALKDFRKDGAEKPIFKAAAIDADLYIGEENLDVLSSLKSKNELIGEIIALLQSPAKNVISGLQASGGQKLSGIIKRLSEKPE
jgi:large subunit ribosomal protein L10